MHFGRSPEFISRAEIIRLQAAVLAFLCVSALPVHAQSVAGRVVDESTGVPVAFAGVALIDSGDTIVTRVTSDSVGSFLLRAPAGMYRLRARGFGYATSTSEQIQLRTGEPVIVELRLSADGIPLEPLVIRARGIERGRDGFARRRDLGNGVFLDADSIKLREPRFAPDAFRAVEGVMMKWTGNGYTIYPLEGGRCMAVYVNNNAKPYAWFGAPASVRGRAGSGVTSARTMDFALGGGTDPLIMVDADAMLGVEVYRTFWEIPEELRTAARGLDLWPAQVKMPCGMAIIWTRIAW